MKPVSPEDHQAPHDAPPPKPSAGIPLVVATAVAAVLALGGYLVHHAESKTNQVALSSEAKPVSVMEARATAFRPQRVYVGRLDPWISANVGPQFVSAYVDTVLVRPGATVKRGQVLATLDCRFSNAMAQAVDMQARALDSEQRALADESSRVSSMLEGGYVSPNEVEQKTAQSAAKEAELLAEKANLMDKSLAVSDCVLRAPFDGDVATRSIDPGAFVRPGASIVSVVDRTTVRMTADVPENDFDVVAPGKPLTIVAYATGQELKAAISRRAPAADPATRTVHIEVDIPDPSRQIPVGTTGEVHIDVGDPIPATEIPLAAASVTDTKSTLYVVDGDVAHGKTLVALGERGAWLYVKPSDLPAGTRVVTEGRAVLKDGDRVTARLEADLDVEADASPSAASSSSGAKL